MTRRSYQQGYVSDPIRTRRGIGHIIRYRVRTSKGKWKQKSEMLYGLTGKKAARAVLNARLESASNQKPETAELTLQDFVAGYWRPYLDRKQVKPSTKAAYESILKIHILPTLGEMRLIDLAPLHIEDLLQAKAKQGLNSKSSSTRCRPASSTLRCCRWCSA